MREADPRYLGVHAVISVPGVPDEVPPEYVARDVDDGEFGVRAKVAAAAKRGGFVLLVGGSSVGKTRCAVEAIRALLPDWWLVHPAGPAEVAALAAAPVPRTVVWLDELQRYLDGGHGLAGVVRALMSSPDPVVIIGTLWPDRYAAYTAAPVPGGADLHARKRQVLELATVIRIDAQFSPAEQDRARVAASRDRRLAIALKAAGYGLTQTLAAAPQLVARWLDARAAAPYAWAVLTAALDVARLGAHAPLNPDLLRAAAPGYCTSAQRAEAPDDWFDQALAYATVKLHGASAALSPAGAGMGQVAGYTAADYLIQHASRDRRFARVPASTWDAVLSHMQDLADAVRLAGSAESRLLYRYAIPLYRHAADAGDRSAAAGLHRLLIRRRDLDELRARADAGDWRCAKGAGWWTDTPPTHRELDKAEKLLRDAARAGDREAAVALARLLAERGGPNRAEEIEEILRPLADAGDRDASVELAGLLAKRGDLNRAEQIMRPLADAGDWYAGTWLAELLACRGDVNGLRARAGAGDGHAARELSRLLLQGGDLDKAEQILRHPADADDWQAAEQLAELLTKRGDLDQLRARADAGDREAAKALAKLLAERGGGEELRARARAGDGYALEQLERQLWFNRYEYEEILHLAVDAGSWRAADRLAKREAILLARRGDLDGLRARAAVGDRHAAEQLPGLLAEQGQYEEATRVERFGLNPDGSTAET